jgi:hypothetical protein
MDDIRDELIVTAPEAHQQPTPPASNSQIHSSAGTYMADEESSKRIDMDEDTTAPDMLSPMSTDGDKQDESELPALTSADLCSPSMGYDFSYVRVGLPLHAWIFPACAKSMP